MAQPPTYSRQVNFNDFSTSNPSSPHSGTNLDSEFNAVKSTTDAINSNLSLIQRDDGKLLNASVHAEALSTAVLALIKATENGYSVRGQFAASTAYAIGDLVESSQATYLCFNATSGGATFSAIQSNFILLANAAIQATASSIDKFSGNGTSVTFNLSSNVPTGNTDVLVFVNGAYRDPGGDYTINTSTNQITFTTAPSNATNNVIVVGSSTTVEAAKQAAQAARDTAETHKNDANDSKLTSQSYATQAASAVVQEFSGGTGTDTSPGVYSAKTYAGDTTAGANTHGGSARGWAQTAEDTAVPGASATDFSAKHYSLKAEDFKDQAAASAVAASGHNISISQVAALAVALG